MSGLASSLNLDSPEWVENTFYVDTRYGTASPPAEGERLDRAYASGDDAITAAINHIQNTPERRAVVWFRPGHHIVYQFGHYCDGGALILHADPGAVITLVRGSPALPTSFITWDFNNFPGDALITGHGIWRWGETPEQSSTLTSPYGSAFRLLGRQTESVLNPGEPNIASFEAETWFSPITFQDGGINFFFIEGNNWNPVKIQIRANKIIYRHLWDDTAFLYTATSDVANIQILTDFADLIDYASLIYNAGTSIINVTYRCPEHYGPSISVNGDAPVWFRLLGGSSLYHNGTLTSTAVNGGMCFLSPAAGQSHIHCGSEPPGFPNYHEFDNPPFSPGIASGEILFTGFTPDFSQPWRNTLCWGESRACIEMDFSQYPVNITSFAGWGLEGQTLRSFDVRVLSPLTPGVTLRFGTSANPLLSAAVTTTTLNTLVMTVNPIAIPGPAYEITSNFEQFAVTRTGGPILNQGRIQLYPRLGGVLKI